MTIDNDYKNSKSASVLPFMRSHIVKYRGI